MRSIQPVHTARVSVQMRELTIGQVQELCTIPYQFEQRTITAFLNAVCEHLPRGSGKESVTDPLLWSVNERMNAVIYYLASMLEDGPDFAIGEGHLRDYLLAEADYVDAVPFRHDDDDMVCTPLHGYQAEAIEHLVTTGVLPRSYFGWQLGAMAACVRGADELPLEYSDPTAYSKQLLARVEALKNAPEREFVRLHQAFLDASMSLQHFVHVGFSDQGVVSVQVTDPDPEKGVPELGYARFHPRSGISRGACEILEAVDQYPG